MVFVPFLLEVDDHLGAGAVVAALDIERLVLGATIEDGLVAADGDGDGVEGLDHESAEPLALMLSRDRDLLDVAYYPAVMDELLLYDEGTRADDMALVLDDEVVVRALGLLHLLVPLAELRLRRVAHVR